MKLNRKLGLLLFGVFSIGALFGQGKERSFDMKIHVAFEHGSYCKVIQLFKEYQAEVRDNHRDWVDFQLILANAYLESEHIDSTQQVLDQLGLENCSIEQIIKRDLLKARLTFLAQNYNKADSLFSLVKTKAKGILEEKHPLLGEILCFHGLLQLESSQFEKGQNSLNVAKKILQNTESYALQTLAITHAIAGFFYIEQSQFFFARTEFEKAKNIWENNGWTQHPYYALLLNDFGLLYLEESQFSTGESLILEAKSISENGCRLPSKYAYSFTSQANLNYKLGNIDKAKEQYATAMELFQQQKQYKELAITMNVLGDIYTNEYYLGLIDSLHTAKSTIEQALIELERVLPKGTSISEAILLGSLAFIFDLDGNTEVADSLYKEQLDLTAKLVGKNSFHYADALNNQAAFMEYHLEDYESADIRYASSLKIYEKIYNPQNPTYLKTLYNLARIKSKLEAREPALNYYKKANALLLNILNNYFADFDEKTRLNYRLEVLGNYDAFLNFACPLNQPNLNIDILNFNLATKNLVADYAARTRNFAKNIDNPKLKENWEAWRKARIALTKAYHRDQKELIGDENGLKKAENVVINLERKLIKNFPNRFKNNNKIDWTEIQSKLNPDEAAIDFFNRFHLNKAGEYTDTTLYYALVIRKDWSAPKLVYLTSKQELIPNFDGFEHYTKFVPINQELYQQVWHPLDSLLGGINTIHLSPDGLLHKIAFDGLLSDASSNEYLTDKYSLTYYSNLSDILTYEEIDFRESSEGLFIGNPSFDTSIDSSNCLSNSQKSSQFSMHFPPLLGTKQELDAIVSMLKSSKWKNQTYESLEANESNFRLAHPNKDIIHLATHGFFLKFDYNATSNSSNLGERFSATANPLLHSGIVLTKANCTWNDSTEFDFNENGILSAQEIVDLDFSKTKLVVLSACETGKGAITTGEGVFGLYRAFKITGVQKLLISLWKVSDPETAKFMGYFYENLKAKLTVNEALKNARNRMKEEGYAPEVWASFVLFQ